jgi:hypothetical protein
MVTFPLVFFKTMLTSRYSTSSRTFNSQPVQFVPDLQARFREPCELNVNDPASSTS